MSQRTAGIHHVTAFVQNAQETVDFYSGVLGLRLVKKTINFDAPEVYHLYFGDEKGSPGTIITFFPAPGSRRGRIGGGQVGVTTYAVPEGTLDFWHQRLLKFHVSVETRERFSEKTLLFRDNSGLLLELVERAEGPASTWAFGGISLDKAIKGFGGAVLYSVSPEKTAHLLEQELGMEKIGQEGSYARFKTAGNLGNIIDINIQPMEYGAGGAGTVHHIAWRAKDDGDHVAWRNKLAGLGYHVTPIVDRQYFNAVYFREEGGILFEIATDPPGFARDEPADKLGEKLMLPDWYEEQRALIEANLEPIEVRILKEDEE